MSRTIGAGLQANFDGKTGENVWLITVVLDSGTQYYAAAGRDFSYGGQTYVGKSIVTMSAIRETVDSSTNAFSFTLTGASSSFVNTYTNIDYIDRVVNVYLAGITSGEVTDVLQLYQGRIEGIVEVSDPESNEYTIRVNCANPLSAFDRVTGHIASDGYHQSVYSGDLGFEYLKESQSE